MSFHERSFAQRFGAMGDAAEAAFDLVYPKSHSLGLNRPPFFMGGMPAPMRNTPDKMTRDRITECMGVGRDRLLKVKTEKLESLKIWRAIGPVHLFVYHSSDGTYYDAPIEMWCDQLVAYGKARTFENDGKAYIELDVEHFPHSPLPLPNETLAA